MWLLPKNWKLCRLLDQHLCLCCLQSLWFIAKIIHLYSSIHLKLCEVKRGVPHFWSTELFGLHFYGFISRWTYVGHLFHNIIFCTFFGVLHVCNQFSGVKVQIRFSFICILWFAIFYYLLEVTRVFLLTSFQLANEKNIPQEELMKEVTAILDDMAHTTNMRTVRSFAFFVIKVFKALFKRVYVSEEGIQMVRFASFWFLTAPMVSSLAACCLFVRKQYSIPFPESNQTVHLK